MKNSKPSKWRRYLNILLGISTSKTITVEYSTCREPSGGAEIVSGSDYRSSSERFIHARGREVYTASGRPGAPEIEYCGF